MLDHRAPEASLDRATALRVGLALAAGAAHHGMRTQTRLAKWIAVVLIAAAAVVVVLAEGPARWAAGGLGVQVALICLAVVAVERIVAWVLRRLVDPAQAAGLFDLVQGRYQDLLAEAGIPTGPFGAARIGLEALLRPSSLRRRVDRAADVIGQRSPELVAELAAALGALR